MGSNKSKPVRISKLQVEITAMRVREYLNLQKERKSIQAIKQEKQLMNLINGEVRNRQEQYMGMERIISILKYLNACRILISYTEILKSNSQLIVESMGNLSRIDHLLPYIEGIIYANRPMGLSSLGQFKNLLLTIFGREMIDPKDKSLPLDRVQKDLISCFEGVKPSFNDVNTYAIEMAKRQDLSLERLNKVGHNFSEYNMGQPNQYMEAQGYIKKPSQGQQPPPNVPPGGFQGGQGGYGQGGYGQGQGGYGQGQGQGQGGYGGQGGNFGQGGYVQGGNYGPPPPGNFGPGGFGPGGFGGGGYGMGGGNQGPPQPYSNNNTFNPDNYMPIYQPNNFGVDPSMPINKAQDFQGMCVPKTAIKFAPDYPEQSGVQNGQGLDLDSFQERLKKL